MNLKVLAILIVALFAVASGRFRSLLFYLVFFYFFFDLTFKYCISAQPQSREFCPIRRAQSQADTEKNNEFCMNACHKEFGNKHEGYCQGTFGMHRQHSPKCLCPKIGRVYGEWEATRDELEWNCIWDHEIRFLMQQKINVLRTQHSKISIGLKTANEIDVFTLLHTSFRFCFLSYHFSSLAFLFNLLFPFELSGIKFNKSKTLDV